MQQKYRTAIFASVGMFVLILDAKTTIFAAREAIGICTQTVIPSLLPFFFLSILLTDSLKVTRFGILRPLGKLCRMSPGCESYLLLGLLGGYPSGAQCVTQAYQSGAISRKEAHRLLGFCSNAGPSFLFGICAAAFSSGTTAWWLWLIHILSAVITGALLPGGYNDHLTNSKPQDPITAPDSLKRSILILTGICGWIILFRVILTFCQRWFLWLLPVSAQAAAAGLLELSNGCLELSTIPSEGLRFTVCSVILAFGGLCVWMQTRSVTGELGMGLYFPGKILQTTVSLVLALICQSFLYSGSDKISINGYTFLGIGFFIVFLSVILQIRKNFSRFPIKVGV